MQKRVNFIINNFMMKPIICNYHATYRCNARCDFCSIWKDTGISPSQEAPADVVKRNLRDARCLGVKVIDFTGGEPLLYEGLPDALAYAKKNGLKTTVTTNGILYPSRSAELAGLIDILQFSLDAATKDDHDAVKGVPAFDSVMESIEIASGLSERPTVIHTVTDDNLPYVPDIISLARKLNVLLYLNPCFAYFGNPGLSRDSVVKLDRLAHGKGVSVDRGYLHFVGDGGNKRDNPICRAVSSTIVISPDDRLILPCFHYKTKTLPIKGNLTGLWNSSEVHKERLMEGRHPFCDGCTVYCYMRASLFRTFNRYFLPSVFSAVKYIYEYYRIPKR